MQLLKPSDILSGDTISYVKVFGDKNGLAIGSDENDVKYHIHDHYCMNPSCKCDECVLVVIKTAKDEVENKSEFAVRISLKNKKYELLDLDGISKNDIDETVKEICTREGIGLLKKRYKDMKEAGRKVIQGNTPKQGKKDELVIRNANRNDPCICGSGKKYKKCCG